MIEDDNMNTKTLNDIWTELKSESKSMRSLIVRNTGIPGLSIAFDPILNSNKIIIRVEEEWSKGMFPNWTGLNFSSEFFDVPIPLPHIVLELTNGEFEKVFTLFCLDLIEGITDSKGSERDGRIQETVNSWNQFFLAEKSSSLSREQQQGLFAELDLLIRILETGDMTRINAINSWKGGERAYHDFQFANRVIEVKSTSSKEPKKVRISNEKQLNDEGIESLFLLATNLVTIEGGLTLNNLFENLSEILSDEDITRDKLLIQIMKYGVMPEDLIKYTTGYNVLQRQYFLVEDGFPRIILCPEGVGDIKYSITVNACNDFEVDEKLALGGFING